VSETTAGTRRFFRTADFQVCRIAGFPTRRPFVNLARPTTDSPADWEIGDKIGWETCGTPEQDVYEVQRPRAQQR
jgi:hypothetical protein